MTRINSVAFIPKQNTVYACGHYWSNEKTTAASSDTTLYNTQAVITRFSSSGNVDLFLNIKGTNPVSGLTSQDECWGILPAASQDGTFYAILSIKMTEVRATPKGNWRDLLLVMFNSDGSVGQATTFSNGNIN